MHVIALQVCFGVLLLVVFAFLLNSMQANLTEATATGLAELLASNSTASVDAVAERIQLTWTQEFTKLFLAAIAVTGLFAFIVSYVTLTPTRNALEAQKRFIGNIAHELRTPLSIIKTNLEVMLLETFMPQQKDKAKQEGQIKESIEELDRTSEIINNLVSFNRMIEPEQVKFGEVELDRVVDAVVSQVGQLAKNKGITLTTERSGTPRVVWGNETALEQLLVNLVRNAVNHTGEGGRVTVGITPEYEGKIMLSVRDTGSGISQKDLLHIFEPFYRTDKSRARRSSGSGLGLTIVNEIVKAHNGKILIKSALRRGTLVSVFLPRSSTKKQKKEQTSSEKQHELALDFTEKE